MAEKGIRIVRRDALRLVAEGFALIAPGMAQVVVFQREFGAEPRRLKAEIGIALAAAAEHGEIRPCSTASRMAMFMQSFM